MKRTHFIAFWNLENLFDSETAPDRSEKLRRLLGKALQGWNEARLARKIKNLARVIRAMNHGRGPDLLGVCEVENRRVLERLAGAIETSEHRYAVAHADTQDRRGIDVAFLYDPARSTVEATFQHWVLRRTATRDLFQVNLRTGAGHRLVVIGNHWPSRLPAAEVTAA